MVPPCTTLVASGGKAGGSEGTFGFGGVVLGTVLPGATLDGGAVVSVVSVEGGVVVGVVAVLRRHRSSFTNPGRAHDVCHAPTRTDPRGSFPESSGRLRRRGEPGHEGL